LNNSFDLLQWTYIKIKRMSVYLKMMAVTKWRFINTGTSNAAWNMAIDEMLLERCIDTPILRLYGWDPSVSVGRYAKVDDLISEVGFVRRISGGGILLHGSDLSYTLVIPRNLLQIDGIKESYRYLSRFILRVYEKLSLKSSFASDQSFSSYQSDICMAGKEAYDILFNGLKLGGHAQRHTRDVIFQHGSIPMDFDDALSQKLFGMDSHAFGITSLRQQGCEIDYGGLAEIVKHAFCQTFDISLYEQGLSLREENRAGELYENKYLNERWNLHGENIQA